VTDEVRTTADIRMSGVPARLHDPVTAAEVAEAQVYRDRMRELAGRGARLNRNERAYNAAVVRAEFARLEIERIEAEGIVGPELDLQRRQLASALVDAGRLPDAYDAATRAGAADLVETIERLYLALHAPDDWECDCEPDRIAHGPLELLVGRWYVLRSIFSERLGDFVKVWACSGCHAWNARPTAPAGGIVLERARSESALSAEGKGPDVGVFERA
jgi:hypothetical protein